MTNERQLKHIKSQVHKERWSTSMAGMTERQAVKFLLDLYDETQLLLTQATERTDFAIALAKQAATALEKIAVRAKEFSDDYDSFGGNDFLTAAEGMDDIAFEAKEALEAARRAGII